MAALSGPRYSMRRLLGLGLSSGNADDGGAVAAAVRDLGRGLEARDEPLVAVGGRVGEGAERQGVLEQAADGVDAQVAQARVTLAGQERLIVFPEREVGVHARAVVAEERLGHERGGLAVAPGHVANDVLGEHDLVGALDQRLRDEVDLALAAGGDLVKVGRRGDAAFGHALGHLGAEVDQAVGRRTGKIAQARARLVAEVGRLVPAAVPDPFDRIDVVERLVPALLEPDVVEDEELELRRQQALIGQPGVPHVADGLAGDVARVAGVVLMRDRILDVADHRQGRLRRERIDQRRLRLRDDQQIGLVDRAPADDARAVEMPMPSSNVSSVSASAGIEKCCQTPGKSMNRRSTVVTSRCRICAKTSFGVTRCSPRRQPSAAVQCSSGSRSVQSIQPADVDACWRIAPHLPKSILPSNLLTAAADRISLI